MSSPASQPLDAIDKFIGLARELANLPDMATPKYAPAAMDLHEISRKLSRANSNMARLLNGFLYFDFLAEDARSSFLALVKDYRDLKASDRFHELKYSCGDIALIYGRHIEGSLGGWFGRPEKKDEAADIFEELGSADADMVAFLHGQLTDTLDGFVAETERLVRGGRFDEAEAAQLRLNVKCAELSEKIERFSSGLSDLVLRFANLAGRRATPT
jgi:hypothetical protein